MSLARFACLLLRFFSFNPTCPPEIVPDPARQDAGRTRLQHSITTIAEEDLTGATVAKHLRHTAIATEALVASTTMTGPRATVRPLDDRWRTTRRLEDDMKSLTDAITRRLPTHMRMVVGLRMTDLQGSFLRESQRTPEREGTRVTTIVAGATGKSDSLFLL